MATATQPTGEQRERLADLPPSAKLVHKVLEHEAALNQQELADATMLPARTVRYALQRLDSADLVEYRPSAEDARQRLYRLPGQDPDRGLEGGA